MCRRRIRIVCRSNDSSMKLLFIATLLLALCDSIALAQWQQQTIKTDADFRGLSVVSAKVAWVSGTKGTYGRTTDGGETWSVATVPGAEKLDFRDVEAFGESTAYLLSAGPGEDSRIYKTTDGGKTWSLQFKNSEPKAFFDAIAFWDQKNGIALSDPVNGQFLLVATDDGGANWKRLPDESLPKSTPNEGAFAASGTCLVTHGENDVWFCTGGGKSARVFHSTDRGQRWTVSETLIGAGVESAGIFSIAFHNRDHGVIVGGDYKKPNDAGPNVAITGDGGKTWKLVEKPLPFRSGVAWAKDRWVAIGTSGSDFSLDDGAAWKPLDRENYNCVGFASTGEGWAAGPKGRIARFAPALSQPSKRDNDVKGAVDKRIAPYFQVPAEFANDFGGLTSPLEFADGTAVKSAADWQKRREQIRKTWHDLMGPWPALIEKPKIEYLEKQARDNFTQHHIRIETAPNRLVDDVYLLVPEGKGPFPAVLVVFYEAKTGIGMGKSAFRDFAYQLAKRGFVTLSLGGDPNTYYPDKETCAIQPLSFHAYESANCCNALANLEFVDAARIGVVGHSYGGKWAMFSSCLYDKFACAVWSDPGIVWDEANANVNYYEPWYLGFELGKKQRAAGVPSDKNPRTGPYKKMLESGRNLHELHALMAPRPFLVSGGSEDKPERWKVLNHAIAVNKLLGADNRVAMTNRQGHSPTVESNEQIYLFFEQFLKPRHLFDSAK